MAVDRQGWQSAGGLERVRGDVLLVPAERFPSLPSLCKELEQSGQN